MLWQLQIQINTYLISNLNTVMGFFCYNLSLNESELFKNITKLFWQSIKGFLLLARKNLILQFDKQVSWWSIQKNVIFFFWLGLDTRMLGFWLMYNSSKLLGYNALIKTFSGKIMTHLHRLFFGIPSNVYCLLCLLADTKSCMICSNLFYRRVIN